MGNLLRLIFRGARKVVLHPGQALLICRMAWWVATLSAAARLYSLPRALQLVAGNPPRGQNGRDAKQGNFSPGNGEQLAQSIDLLLSADVLVFKPICWKRAAVLHRYLLKRGVETQIVFGVRNDPKGKLDGHAWLEHEGKPILEKAPPEYVVTYSFPSNQPFNTQLATLSHE